MHASLPRACRPSSWLGTTLSLSKGRRGRFFEAVDRGDVRVVQRGEHLRFAFEAREPIGIEGEGFRQDLDRDFAIELRVACAVHLTHPADADDGADLIRTETRAGSKGQQVLWIIRAEGSGREITLPDASRRSTGTSAAGFTARSMMNCSQM